MKIYVLFLFFLVVFSSCSEQEIEITPVLNKLSNSSIRGLYSVDNGSLWASGANGIVFRYGKNNQWIKYQDTSWSDLDFRDVHSFSEEEAIIMSSGDGCEIYKTNDAGKTWRLVYENYQEGIFFDGMDFWDDKNGLAFSDPINDKLYMIETKDGGESWEKIKSLNLPQTLLGEAGFAASGTGIVCVGDSTVYIGTGGGEVSRVFISHDRGKNWKVVNTPMRSGKASGIYSMLFLDDLNGVAVGGNYLDSVSTQGNCVITSDGGLTWKLPNTMPSGYMSCVAYNKDGVLLCTGRNGIDVSYDKGNNWKHITDDAYYSCVLYKKTGWLTGRAGKMAKIVIK
ncbi:MAG: oxidoreductase [Flavobacteriales bacterium]|nr:MAG: oxidoreductase [Flavobacteriales bacterium]